MNIELLNPRWDLTLGLTTCYTLVSPRIVKIRRTKPSRDEIIKPLAGNKSFKHLAFGSTLN